MGLTVNRQMAKKLTVNRQKWNIFTVKNVILRRFENLRRASKKQKLAVKFLRYP